MDKLEEHLKKIIELKGECLFNVGLLHCRECPISDICSTIDGFDQDIQVLEEATKLYNTKLREQKFKRILNS